MSIMPARLRVEIVQIDLETAFKGDAFGCAIVACIMRKYPNLTRPVVTGSSISVTDPTTRTRYTWPIPAKALEWIQIWDGESNPGPLKFALETEMAFAKETRQRSMEQRFNDKMKARERREKFTQQIKSETPNQAQARKEAVTARKKSIRRGKVKTG